MQQLELTNKGIWKKAAWMSSKEVKNDGANIKLKDKFKKREY